MKIRNRGANLGAGNTVKVSFALHQKHRINKAIAYTENKNYLCKYTLLFWAFVITWFQDFSAVVQFYIA